MSMKLFREMISKFQWLYDKTYETDKLFYDQLTLDEQVETITSQVNEQLVDLAGVVKYTKQDLDFTVRYGKEGHVHIGFSGKVELRQMQELFPDAYTEGLLVNDKFYPAEVQNLDNLLVEISAHDLRYGDFYRVINDMNERTNDPSVDKEYFQTLQNVAKTLELNVIGHFTEGDAIEDGFFGYLEIEGLDNIYAIEGKYLVRPEQLDKFERLL